MDESHDKASGVQVAAKEIFADVCDLPVGQRAAAIGQRCGADAGLRQAVEALLEAHDRAGRFMEAPTAATPEGPATAAVTTDADGHDDALPRRVGRYRLLQVIGEGGFGRVYMAEQEQPIRRRVAVKVIKLGMDTRQVIARFEAERQALAMMDHPDIARVLDAGSTESGRPFFVMELVNGVPITQYCDANRLTTRQRLELFVPVCQAVQHAHQKGIIHRDLKPTNVLVTLHDGVPVPKVIDFGIAKATQARLTEKTLFTAFRQFIGTPEYMSPEQAETSGLDIDTRSDVYSLGVLLYELLTGTTPFEGTELRGKAYDEMQRIIREVEPPRPSTRLATMGQKLSTVASQRQSDPRKLGGLVRGELDWVVMKCLEKDRTRRYDSASALAADVKRHLDGEAVAARPATAGYRLRKFVARHKLGAIAAAAVAGALVLGVVGTSIGLVRARWALSRATTAEGTAKREGEAALAAKGRAEDALAKLGKANTDLNTQAGELRHALYISTVGFGQSALKAGDVKRARELLASADVRERGFEWALLNWLSDRSVERVTIEPAPGQAPAMAFAFTPDGSRAATAHKDGTVTVWDAPAKKPLRSFQAYPPGSGEVYLVHKPVQADPVAQLHWSMDGKRLLSVSGGALPAKVWDADTGNEICTLEGPSQGMQSVRIGPEDLLVAVPTAGAKVHPPHVWDLRTGKVRLVLRAPEGPAGKARADELAFGTQVALSPGGRWALGRIGVQTCVWDTRDGSGARSIEEHGIEAHAVGDDGLLLFYGDPPRVLMANSGLEVVRFKDVQWDGHGATFSPDGRLLALTTSAGPVVAEVGGQNRVRTLAAAQVPTWLRFSDDGRTLTGGSPQHATWQAWDVGGDEYFTLRTDRANILGLSGAGGAGGGGQLVLSQVGHATGRMIEVPGAGGLHRQLVGQRHVSAVWIDARTGQPLRSVECGKSVVDGPHLAGNRLVVLEKEQPEATPERSCVVRVLDAETGKEVASVRGLPGMAAAVALSADGRRVAVARTWLGPLPFPAAVNVIDVASGQFGPALHGFSGPPRELHFSPDSRRLATVGEGETCLFDADTGRRLARLPAYVAETGSCAFSPDSSRLVVPSWAGGHVTVLDAATGKELARLGHARVDAATYSPDGKRLLSVGQILKVWDTRTWNELASAPLAATALFVAPDGSALAASDNHGQVMLLDCRESDAALRSQRQALRVRQLAEMWVRNLRRGEGGKGAGMPLADDEVRKALEAEPSLEPAVRSAAVALLAAADPQESSRAVLRAQFFRVMPQPHDPAQAAAAAAWLEKLSAKAPDDLAVAGALGEVQFWAGQLEKAQATLRRAAALHAKASRESDPWHDTFLAMALFKLGRHDEAKQSLGAALARPSDRQWVVELVRNPTLRHAEQMVLGLDLAPWAAAAEAGDLSNVRPTSAAIAEKRREALGPGHPATVRALAALAPICEALGDLAAAEKALRDAYAAAATTADASRRLERWRPLVEMLRRQGGPRNAAALAELAAAARPRAAQDGAARDEIDAALGALGDVLRRLGRADESAACWRELLDLRLAAHGPAHAPTIEGMEALADALGRKPDAAGVEALLLDYAKKLPGDDEQSLWARERVLGRLVGSYRSANRPELGRWRDELRPTQRKLFEAQAARFSRQLQDSPRDAEALGSRALAHARLGLFKEAADDYEAALRYDPRDHWLWYYQGCLLAYLGQRERYAAHCAAMLDRFGDTGSNVIADRTAKACLLIDGAGGDPSRLSRLADLALSRADAGLLPWFAIAKGLAEYRLGHYDECVRRMEAARSGLSQPTARAAADLFIAMSHHRRGRAADADAAYRRALDLIEREVGKPGVDDLASEGLENWLVCMTAWAEAERLLGRAVPPR